MRARLILIWLFYGGMLTAQPEEFTLKSGEQLSHANQYGQSTEQLEAFIRSNPSRLYDQSEALLLISYNHMQLGDYANALATNEASLSIKAQLQADDLVKNYVRYGAIHVLRGNYALALSYLMRSKDLPIEDIPLYAVIDGHLAAAYRGLGQYEEAAGYYRQSIETLLIEFPEDHPEIIVSYYNLGQLYREWGKFEEARKYFEEGLDRCSSSSDHAFLRAMLYNGIGQTHADRPELAAEVYQQALDVANQNFGKYHRETAHAALLLAQNLLARQEREAAQKAILSAIQSLSPEQANLSWEEMPDSANIAIDPMLLGVALGLRAEWLRQSPQPGADQLNAALTNSEQAAYWLTTALAQRIDQANRAEVLQAARTALLPGILAGLQLWETEKYQPAQLRAFRLTEAIRQLEYRAHTTNALGFSGTFADQERKLRRSLQLAEMNFRLQPLDITGRQEVLQQRAAYAETLREWQSYDPDSYRLRFGRPLPSATGMQANLAPGTTLLSYLMTEEDLYLLALNHEDIQTFIITQDSPSQIQDLRLQAKELQEAIRQNDASAFILVANQLYRQLLTPAASMLAKTNTLIVLPDGSLNDIPFEVLLTQNPKDDRRPFSKLDYLIKDMSVHYQYRAAFDEFILTEGAAERQLSVLSPDPEKNELSPVVKKLRKGTYGWDKATETYLRQQLQTATYLHLAGGAFVHDDLPETAGLQLAKPSVNEASPGDGILHASEVLALTDIKALLISMDSVSIHRDPFHNLQPLNYPLVGSLLHAGVQSVLYPKWAEPSGALLSYFYREVLGEKAADKALQAAQKMMIKKKRTASPKFWAGYRLYQ